MKITGLSLALLAAIVGLVSTVSAQSSPAPKPDVSLADSKKISPFPPKTVEVEFSDGLATVKWTKVLSEKITGYDVYRVLDDGKFEKVGHTKETKFVDKSPTKDTVKYAVASVDYNDNRSKPREAILQTSQ